MAGVDHVELYLDDHMSDTSPLNPYEPDYKVPFNSRMMTGCKDWEPIDLNDTERVLAFSGEAVDLCSGLKISYEPTFFLPERL